MKTLIILSILSTTAFADCKTSNKFNITENKDVAFFSAPKELKDAAITVTLANGKSYIFSSNEYMVAKRKQTVKTVTLENQITEMCRKDEKNEILLGARQDVVGLDKSSTASSATLKEKKGAVLDATYVRHEFIGPVNVGVGIDSNVTPKAVIGFDF